MDVLVDLTPLDSAARYRGIGRYVAELGRALAALEEGEREGLDLAALTGLSGPRVTADLAWPGDAAFRTYPGCHRVYRWRRRRLLDRAAARSGARLWHHTDPTGTPRRATLPFVVTCFDLIPLVLHELYLARRPWAREKQHRIDAHRYLRAERVLAISEATKGDLVEQLGADPARVDVVPLGIDDTLFHPHAADGEDERVRRTYRLARPFVLYVGGGDERKNLPHLVRAFAAAGVAEDVDLVLAGVLLRDQLAGVRQVVDAERVGRAVHLLGHVPDADVAALYRTCVLHACPSLYEGFGLTVAESMACGAPTLSTCGGSLAEVASGAALVVGGDDVDETAAALLRLAADADLRADVARRGLERARSFRWDATARGTVRCYRRALDATA